MPTNVGGCPGLSSWGLARWLRTLQDQGYRTHITFLSLPSADLAVARVAERVRQGGHDVPQAVIRRRFEAGLTNFFALFEPVADSRQMVDNSGTGIPRLVARKA